jgi:F0F1-type ATP synthase assembly protein I
LTCSRGKGPATIAGPGLGGAPSKTRRNEQMYRAFMISEAGGATVDWVLITALMIGLGLSVMTVMESGLSAISEELTSHMNMN